MSHPVDFDDDMTSNHHIHPSTLRHTGRRGFLGLLGTAIWAPLAAKGAWAELDSSALGTPHPDETSLEDEREAWLREWANHPRIPIWESQDPLTAALLEHSHQGRALAVFYRGGTHPGRMRRFSPDLVFRHERCRHVYVSGFCHQENAPRILRLDRMELA